MKRLIRLAMCFLLLGFGVERAIDGTHLFAADTKADANAKASAPPKTDNEAKPAASQKTSGKKTDAKGALAGAKKAHAVMIKEARSDKGLDPKTPKNKPFWNATQKLSKNLDRAEKGLKEKNDDFFKAVSDARTAEQQMKVDWQLTGSKNKKVIDAAKKTGRALAILRTDFSKEAARKKKGGPLTEKEKEQFAKIKKEQTALLAKVKALEAKAKKDKALGHGLKKIAIRADKVAKAPETLDGFLATLYLLDEIEGLLYGYDYYIDKGWRADWVDVVALTTGWELVYTDILTSEVYTWTDVDVTTDIHATEEFAVSEEISTEEIESQENFGESESFAMSDAEEDAVAAEEDNDPNVEADDVDDDDSMEDASDDDGEDFDGDGDDDVGGEDDDGGDDSDDGSDDSDDDVHDSDDDVHDSDDDGGDDDGDDDDGGDGGEDDDGE